MAHQEPKTLLTNKTARKNFQKKAYEEEQGKNSDAG